MSEQQTLDEALGHDANGDGWRSATLADVADKRSENVEPQAADVDRHVGLEHITPNYPYPAWESIDELSSTKRRFYPGDILFAKLRPNLEKVAQPSFHGICSTDIFPITAREGVNSKYLLYRLSSKEAYDHARRTSAGTRMPRTSWSLFSKLEFDLPPIEEQRNIATVLQNVDEYIQKTNSVVDQLYKVRKGIVLDFLAGKLTDENLKETRLGPKKLQIPESWKIAELGEIADVKNGVRIPPGDEYADRETGYRFVRISDLEDGEIDEEGVKHLTENSFEEMNRGYIHTNDLFLTLNGHSIGGVGLCPPELDGAHFTDNAAKITNLDEVIPDYLHLYLQSYYGQGEISRFTVGSGQPKLSLFRSKRIEVLVPPISQQKGIKEVVSGINEVIRSEKKSIRELKRFKQGLIQDLLSGKVRTHDMDIETLDEIRSFE